MTYGDYRDGTAISFTPKARTTTGPARLIGALLIVAAAGLCVLGIWSQQKSVPLRDTGASAIGVLVGYEEAGQADYALVQFQASSDTVIARSVIPVPPEKQKEWGAVYQVVYDQKQPERTFIEGLDPLADQWELYGAAGGTGALGLLITVFPFRIRSRS